jgi:hypothetical protein
MYANVHLGSFQVDELQPVMTGEESATSLLPAATFGCWGDLSSAPRTPAPRVDLTRLGLGTILPGDAVARTSRREGAINPRDCGRREQSCTSGDHVVNQQTAGGSGSDDTKSRRAASGPRGPGVGRPPQGSLQRANHREGGLATDQAGKLDSRVYAIPSLSHWRSGYRHKSRNIRRHGFDHCLRQYLCCVTHPGVFETMHQPACGVLVDICCEHSEAGSEANWSSGKQTSPARAAQGAFAPASADDTDPHAVKLPRRSDTTRLRRTSPSVQLQNAVARPLNVFYCEAQEWQTVLLGADICRRVTSPPRWGGKGGTFDTSPW